MTLDEVFASQSSIAAAVKQELDSDMAAFGYEIVNVLVTDIIPDSKVKSAMNDINAAQREQVAASARGEADKILVVKKAEAEAESKALQGQGIANQRKAIIEGLQVSIEQFQKVVEGASAKEVMQLVMVTQYFDTLKSIGENDKTNTLFLSHSPAAVKDVRTRFLSPCWWPRARGDSYAYRSGALTLGETKELVSPARRCRLYPRCRSDLLCLRSRHFRLSERNPQGKRDPCLVSMHSALTPAICPPQSRK